eukprot:gene627-8131_t
MWKKFKFFETQQITDKEVSELISNTNITCSASGRGNLSFGDNSGMIHLIDRNNKISNIFAFQNKVQFLKQVKPNFLIAIGLDSNEDVKDPILKIYNLDKLDPKTDDPQLISTTKIFQKGVKIQPSPVSCLDVTNDFTTIAIGLTNGGVILFSGELARGRIQTRGLPVKNTTEITGIGFRPEENGWCLFVATVSSVYRHRITPKGIEIAVDLDGDGNGSDPKCSTITNEGDFVIARQDGVWFYKPEGKGSCYAFEGKKLLIQWYRNYLVVLSNDSNRKNSMEQIVTIYDLQNKYIAIKLTLEKSFVSEILQEWGNLFILVNEKAFDGQMTQKIIYLEEKDTQSKLELLFQKNLYKIAIDLVKSQKLDSNYVVDISRKHGDHLYSKKKYDEAMDEYKRTIGELEPSYVIRKYLDAQRIHNLTNYLEDLHEKKLATSDHTTLLLNCYAKLKDEKKDKLDNFIKNNAELHYDVETAIKVCRQSGYIEHALALAKKHYEHEWFIKIQIEDLQNEPNQSNYKNALQHIESLPFDLAEKFLLIYGKVLMANIPKRTTNVLIRLCSNYQSIPFGETNRELKMDNQSTPQKSKSEIFIHAFSNQPKWLLIFLENVIFRNPNPPQPKIVFNSLIELYIKEIKKEDVKNKKFEEEEENIEGSIDEEESEFDNFEGEDEEESDDFNYNIPNVDDQFSKLSYDEKVIYLLDQNDSNYDPEHVLVLVQTYHFEAGILKMYEKLRLNYDILQHYMRKKDYQNVIQSCIKYGNNDQNMWIQVLSFFANATDSNYDQEINQILQKIEKDDILPPLLVIQILSKKTQIGTIKEYLIKKLQQENTVIQSDIEKINENKQETEKMRSEIHELKTTAKIFQLPACSLCGRPLELPAVHFMCVHSYHQRCLNDIDECPICINKNREVLEMKKMFEESSDQHEEFFLQLKKQKENGFSVVSDYFGRGIFKSSIIDQTLFQNQKKSDLFGEEDDNYFVE